MLAAVTAWAAAAPASASDVIDGWIVPPVLASGTPLPAPPGGTVRWQADGIVVRDGTVVNERATAAKGQVTGTMALPGGATVTRRFPVTVLGRDAPRLFAYARVPTDARAANQPVIARSVHLALGPTAREATPLHDNYGVLFARGVYTAVDRVALRGVADPAPFHFADGSLGIIATRVDMAGTADAGSAIVFKAPARAPADFVELGMVALTQGAVVAPRATWDGAARRYVVTWRDRAGAPHWTVVRDLARTERVATPFQPEDGGRRSRIAAGGNVGATRDGAIVTVDTEATVAGEPARGLAVDTATARALRNRFGRIVNTASRVAPVTIAAGDKAALAAIRARLTYSDGSVATRAVDWDAQDLARIAAAAGGTFTLRGTIRQRTYPPIFAYERADPVIHRYVTGGKVRYLFTATDDTNNGNVVSPHLPLRVADGIAALADANGGRSREVDLLNRRTRRDRTLEGRTIAGCYWAPELHEIGGRLTILFAPCFNPNDDRANAGGEWFTVQSHLMQLREGGDPADPAAWSQPAAVRKADGSPLGRADFPANISLDMSYFTAGGRSYYVWSQRYIVPDGGPMGDPLMWIARVDPRHPTRLASDPRPIIAPDLSFEENLAEGGFVQIRDGRVNLTYSGSGVSPTYVVGGIWAPVTADLTDIARWRKWQAPLQKSQPMPPGPVNYRDHEQGPGHGAYTTDEDGVPLYVYHTWGDGVGGDGRDARVRRLHWAADGRPVLDMTPEEEVAPAYRAVATTVTVAP